MNLVPNRERGSIPHDNDNNGAYMERPLEICFIPANVGLCRRLQIDKGDIKPWSKCRRIPTYLYSPISISSFLSSPSILSLCTRRPFDWKRSCTCSKTKRSLIIYPPVSPTCTCQSSTMSTSSPPSPPSAACCESHPTCPAFQNSNHPSYS